jgi:NAD(P)-dependent dehydrogenase (short-subunit alcohol dehydrogenase family)
MEIQFAEQDIRGNEDKILELMVNAEVREKEVKAAEAELKASGGDVHAYPADLADPMARERTVEAVTERFDGLDVLINGAGVAAYGPFKSGTEEVLRAIMEINFFGAVKLVQRVVQFGEVSTTRSSTLTCAKR